MNRRNFIVNAAGSILAVPFASQAQKSAVPVIGFLNGGSPAGSAYLAVAFREGLKAAGYVVDRTWRSNSAGRTVSAIYRRRWLLSWFGVPSR
jgi:hypothetical protein